MKKIIFSAVFLAAFTSCSYSNKFSDFSEKEKAMLVTVEDLNRLGFDYSLSSSAAKCTKYQIKLPVINHYVANQFEYLLDNSQSPDTSQVIYMQNYIAKSGDLSAKTSNYLMKQTLGSGIEDSGITVTELSGFKKFTPDYKICLLSKGAPAGNIVTFTHKGIQFFFVMAGAYIDDPKVWDPFFEKKFNGIVSIMN